jgi:hypothetical protein
MRLFAKPFRVLSSFPIHNSDKKKKLIKIFCSFDSKELYLSLLENAAKNNNHGAEDSRIAKKTEGSRADDLGKNLY